MAGYGSLPPRQMERWPPRKLEQPRRRGLAASGAVLVASAVLVVAVVGFVPRRPTEQLQVWQASPGPPNMLMEMMGPREFGHAGAPRSRRTLALEERLSQQLQGVESLDQVDHAQLERALRDHLYES